MMPQTGRFREVTGAPFRLDGRYTAESERLDHAEMAVHVRDGGLGLRRPRRLRAVEVGATRAEM